MWMGAELQIGVTSGEGGERLLLPNTKYYEKFNNVSQSVFSQRILLKYLLFEI